MIIKTASLSPEQLNIMLAKATEYPFTGEYNDFNQLGTYLCRLCGLALFRAEAKFHSGCGWPSFDSDIPHHVLKEPDIDEKRTEILCARCKSHLGHIFFGEHYTALNTRHCVNSASLDYVSNRIVEDSEEAIFAAGCFWGVEYYLKKLEGILKVEVGYSGGEHHYPTYEDVCRGGSGHFESVRVIYDPNVISYKQITQYFFEIHDPTQLNGQGPDLGEQYLSVIFYYDEKQQTIAKELIQELKHLGYAIATRVLPVSIFWPAENYHQNYYQKTGKLPYCHHYKKLFK